MLTQSKASFHLYIEASATGLVTRKSEIEIRDTVERDLPEILEIYNDAIVNLTSTFDVDPQSLVERRDWLMHHGPRHPLISAEANEKIVGYCGVSPFSQKRGYSTTVELSVYVHREFRSKGIGTLLVREMISRAKLLKYHAIVSIIAGGNDASVKLHRKLGFERVGHLKQVGFKFSKWQDVDYYELLL